MSAAHKLPDLNGLATLRAVVERGGVNEAAQSLFISQSAVTKRLRALDDCYGISLMEKVGTRLRLTKAGEKVYLAALLTLDHHTSLQDELNNMMRGGNSLRLEVTFSIGEHLLPDKLIKFQEKFPDYEIESSLAYSRQIQLNLAMGRADMALMEIAPDHPDIVVQQWLEDELWLVCGPTHPLAGTDIIPIEDLTKLKFVLREKKSSSRQTLDKALSSVSIDKLKVALEIGSTEAIIDMLEHHGKYVSFMPRFSVEESVEDGDLCRIKVNGFRIMRTLWIARNKSALDHPVAEALISILRK